MEQLALTVSEACAAARIGRTSLYAAIKSGELVAAKYGRKTIVRVGDLQAWLARLPTVATMPSDRTEAEPKTGRRGIAR